MADRHFTYQVGSATKHLKVADDVEAVRISAQLSLVSGDIPQSNDAPLPESSSEPRARRRIWFDSYTIRRSRSVAPADPQILPPEADGAWEFDNPPGVAKPRVFEAGGSYLVAGDRLIVSTRGNADLDAAWLAKYDLDLVVRRKAFHVVRLRSGQDTFDAMTVLSRDALVNFAEPDFAVLMATELRDEFFDESFDAHVSDQYALHATNCPGAWQLLETEGRRSEVTIAIIDDGIDIRHPDLAQRITSSAIKDFTGNAQFHGHDGHGTACAGLAAAAASPAQAVP